MSVISLLSSLFFFFFFFFSSRRRHTRCSRDWSSDVCSSDLERHVPLPPVRWLLGDRQRRGPDSREDPLRGEVRRGSHQGAGERRGPLGRGIGRGAAIFAGRAERDRGGGGDVGPQGGGARPWRGGDQARGARRRRLSGAWQLG